MICCILGLCKTKTQGTQEIKQKPVIVKYCHFREILHTIIMCVKKSIKSFSFGTKGTFFISNQSIFYGELAEPFRFWIAVVILQISSKIRAWVMRVKLAKHAFT